MTDAYGTAPETPSPFQLHLGYRLQEWRQDYALLHLDLAPFHMNRSGVPHGGVYATLLDAAMGYAGCFAQDTGQRRLALTLSLNTQFLSRPKGNLLITEAHKVGGGASVFFAEGRILDETGELIATAAASMKYRGATR